MTINCVRIQWRQAFVLSAAIALAACSSSSTTNDAGRTLGGSGGTTSPSSGGSTARLDAAVASTGGATVGSGGSTTGSNTGVDAAQSDSRATGGTGGGASAADGAAGQSGGDAPAAGGTQIDAAIADGPSDSPADVGTFGDRGTDGDGGGDGENTDAHLLADVSGSVDVASPASIDAGPNVFVRPADGTGTVFLSSWGEPYGSDADEYVYDDFTPAADGNISQVLWRGAYMNNQLYTTAVTHFTITFYDSVAGGFPNITNPQLPETYLAFYDTKANAGEAVAGSFGGVTMYDYQYYLPTPFHVVAGTKYWIRIEASQNGIPDWGIARGTGGDGTHYMYFTGLARFATVGGDVAFTLR